MRLSETSVTRRNAVAVKAAVLEAACGGDDVLDFSGVTAVDSTSVSILMSWVRAVTAAGRRPCVRGVPDKMRSLMRLYGVERLLEPAFEA